MNSVSIIIPALNEEKYLSGCLQSIAELDFPENKLEVIVIDNGSTDRTKEIAINHGARFLQDTILNVGGLRNLGAQNAKNDILAFVDADCLVTRDWLSRASKYFQEHDIIVWGAPPSPPDNPTWVQKTWYYVRKKARVVETVEWLESMNFFIRKSDYEQIEGFNETLVTCEDVDLCYRAQQLGRIVSDSRISVIHLGEAATLKEFFRKELWRGTSNYKGIFSHGFSLKEIPSLFVPIYFVLIIPLVCSLFLFTQDKIWLSLSLIVLLAPLAGIYCKLSKKNIDPVDWFRIFFLVYFYFIARSFSIFKM